MIIGIVGKAGSGKDTVAKFLGEQRDRVRAIAFAEPMKWFVKDVYDFSAKQMWGPSEERNAVDPRYGFSPRQAWQTLGTEWGRALYANTWVDLGMRRAKEHHRAGYHVVITDCRFQNEADAIRAAGGQVWRVIRPSNSRVDTHLSETEQDTIAADIELINDGTLDDLENLVLLIGNKLGMG